MLHVFRGEPLKDKYVLVVTKPHEQWQLARLSGERGKPLTLIDMHYTCLLAAERDIFRRRWKDFTGQDLPFGPGRGQWYAVLILNGYSDRIYGRPGDAVRFMVSCEVPLTYNAEIVRIVCGDDNPLGPGIKEIRVATAIDGVYQGRQQSIRAGSYISVPRTPRSR